VRARRRSTHPATPRRRARSLRGWRSMIMVAVDLGRATEEEWDAHVRSCFELNPLQCVLPVSREPGVSLLNFAQGSLGTVRGQARARVNHHPFTVTRMTRSVRHVPLERDRVPLFGEGMCACCGRGMLEGKESAFYLKVGTRNTRSPYDWSLPELPEHPALRLLCDLDGAAASPAPPLLILPLRPVVPNPLRNPPFPPPHRRAPCSERWCTMTCAASSPPTCLVELPTSSASAVWTTPSPCAASSLTTKRCALILHPEPEILNALG